MICYQENANLNNNKILVYCYYGENSKHWHLQMLTQMWRNRNSHSLLAVMKNDTVTLDDSWKLSYPTEHLFYDPEILCIHSYALKTLCSYKALHVNIYSGSIHIAKIWKQPRYLSVVKWINCYIHGKAIIQC